ncbi:thiolase family protein [Arthrobacter roseus]|uniref:thiolase family protein n=1 Tax=Arthrobacter roseus TaxID=136274 RepID=UPI003083EFD2|nr:acetyl-CoA C-acetyltransferase [Arthrobacter roseus]
MNSFRDSSTPVIVAVKRTPFGLVNGWYKSLPAEELLSLVLKAVCDIPETEPIDVVIGNAAVGGGNIARLGLLMAGYPNSTPGLSIDRQCSSGLDAILLAATMIAGGGDGVYVAGGVESCSTRPLRARRPSTEDGKPDFYDRPQFAPPESGDPDLGVAAENVAQQFGITRHRQDEFALESHRRALALRNSSLKREDLVAVGDSMDLDDQGPRRGLRPLTMSRFDPVFAADGTVTAGNSCRDADGAAVAVLMSAQRAERLGFTFWLEFDGAVTTGVDAAVAGIAGGVAARTLGTQLDFEPHDCAVIEFNEAFAAQVLASADIMGIPSARLNRDGGALAIGHP